MKTNKQNTQYNVLDTIIHKTQDEDKQTKYTMQYVLDTTYIRHKTKTIKTKYTIQYMLDTTMRQQA